jgi:hypothetical protein
VAKSQSTVSRTVAEQAFSELLRKVDDGIIVGEKAQARLCSSARREASIILETLPTASRLARGATCLQCFQTQGWWSPTRPPFTQQQPVTGGGPQLPTVRRQPPGTKRSGRKYGVGTHRAPLGFTPLTTETYGRMGAPAHESSRNWPLRRPPQHRPDRR